MADEPQGTIKINGIPFTPIKNIRYKNNYVKIAEIIETPSAWQKALGLSDDLMANITQKDVEQFLYRHLILTDLWFIVNFVLKVPGSNHPFVVQQCLEVENGPSTMTLDIWARGHWKTTIISAAETIQYHLKYPDRCTLILAYKRGLAEAIVDVTRKAYESEFLIFLFPDRLYANPASESPKWSTQNGIIIKRSNLTRKEPTVGASGLIEGMAQGFHYERLLFDDFETEDMSDSPDVLDAVFKKFLMALFLDTKTEIDVKRVIGTIYSHMGPIVRTMEMKYANGKSMFHTRIVPGTVGGEFDGEPVLWTKEIMEVEKVKPHYPMQVLCNPTPLELRKLNSEYLKEIEPEFIPRDIIKFMVVDPAGDDHGKGGDAWAILVCGISPKPDDIGASDVYIMQAIIAPLTEAEAPEEIARMYLNGGIIQKVGVEKVALSTTELHVANALAVRGRRISIDEGSLILLKPAGREKNARILNALSWPLNNGKLHISKSVPNAYRERIKMEMDKFPYWKKDSCDALAYLYDMIKDADLMRLNTTSQYNYATPKYTIPTICG